MIIYAISMFGLYLVIDSSIENDKAISFNMFRLSKKVQTPSQFSKKQNTCKLLKNINLHD